MKLQKVHELDFAVQKVIGGFAFIPYQLALGISFRIWCTGPAIRIYFGPFKFWIAYIISKDI